MANAGPFVPVKPIPYSCQTLGEAEISAVLAVLQSSYLTQGPAIQAFEAAIADYCQVPYAVAFSSGTAALHGACAVAGLGPGDEAITTPISFVATANAVLYQDATPVFADIHPQTWNLDPDAAEARRTVHTKAILPVHFGGLACDLERFYALAERYGWVVIEDACHALGGRTHGRPIGQCRDMAVFSFHPVKSITTGEGGVVVTPHRHYYEKLLAFRTHGITREPSQFVLADAPPWHYEMHTLGFNYRMTDLQAALGTAQMTQLDAFIAERNRLAQRYRKAFANLPTLTMQAVAETERSAYHLFPICLTDDAPIDRSELYTALRQAHIQTQVHYRPIPKQPYYKNRFGDTLGTFPHAEHYAARCLSLPLYPALGDAAQDYVIDQVRQWLAGNR